MDGRRSGRRGAAARGRMSPPGGMPGRGSGSAHAALAVAGCAVVVGAAAFVLPGGLVPRSGDGGGGRLADPAPAAAARPRPGTRPPAPAPAPAPVGPASPDPRLRARVTLTHNAGCTVSANLVPSCGAWWGVAPAAFTTTPHTEALHDFERKIGRTVDIYHAYHRGDQMFPTAEEMAIAREPDHRRMLLLNWKPDTGRTWASVAAGSMDGQIDRLAAHIRATFPEKFFLVIHHEPEEEVRETPGSGHTADDYRNMFRHVVQRFRADGVRNALFTAVFMGSQKWGVQPWFDRLYPGSDVVDWLGMDPYASADTPDFSHLVNMTSTQGRGFPGFYTWAGRIAPGKPIMMAEWGVFSTGARKAAFFKTVATQLKRHPRIKALVYFDTPRAPFAGFEIDTRVDSSASSLDAYQTVSNNPQFNP
ncbi:MAG TPA: hypothetical protein VF069_10610 [Streptosporangiaceae bacterium]